MKIEAGPKLIVPIKRVWINPPKRRTFLMGMAGAAGSFVTPILKASACQVVTAATGFPGQSTNPVGYAAYSGYSGSLTAWPGGSFATNGTYSGYLFDGGTSTAASVSNTGVTFNGCYFGSSSGNSSQKVMTSSAGSITFNYCTFGPSPSVVGGSFPPQPPSGGGYSTWPTLNSTSGLAAVNGYQYGPVSDGASVPSGGMTFNYCDAWGFGNGLVFSHTNSSNPVTYNNCWVHDPRNAATYGDHTDGIGDVQSESGDYVEYLTVTGCTVAIDGNTQDLALQLKSDCLANNITITNNYWAGNEVTFDLGVASPTLTTPPTNYVFTGNVLGATPEAGDTIIYASASTVFSTSGSGNKWRNNTFAGGTYVNIGAVSAGYYLWPDGSANATDWTGAY